MRSGKDEAADDHRSAVFVPTLFAASCEAPNRALPILFNPPLRIKFTADYFRSFRPEFCLV